MTKTQCFLVSLAILFGVYIGIMWAFEFSGTVNLRQLAHWLMESDVVSKFGY